MKIEVMGNGTLAVLEKQMPLLPLELQKKAYGSGFRRSGQVLMRRIKANVASWPANPRPPIFRGKLRPRLKDAIRVKLRAGYFEGRKVPGASASVVVGVPHAYWLERGSGNLTARPFMEPALEGAQAEMLSAFRKGAAANVQRTMRNIARGNVSKSTGRALARAYA